MSSNLSQSKVFCQQKRLSRENRYDRDKMHKAAKKAEEFISKQSLEKGVAVVKQIYKETPTETANRDRRRK